MEDFIHLVLDAQSGSHEAFALLIARFQNMAYGYAYAILGDFDLAQDAAQEAFIEAYQILPALRLPLAFPVWLKRIVYKYCNRLVRRKQPGTMSLEKAADIVSPQPGIPEWVERNELSRQVNKALLAIPANLRTVAILFYISGYSHQEIADFLGVPPKTVKSRLHTSRQRIKERMLEMMQVEFDHNPLPEQFTRETAEKALHRAVELNKSHQYNEAEKILRSLLIQVPEHPAALKELNRAVMQGRVYGRGRWDLLAELAAQGKMILKTSDDDEIHRQVAQTLLAIPTMRDAILFLESWIAEKGPTLERLGMLAWAKSCCGDFPSALALWNQLISFARSQPEEEAHRPIRFIAYTLVNSFSAAGDLERAQAIAKQAWDTCIRLDLLDLKETTADASGWLSIWQEANLDLNGIAPVLLARHPESTELSERAVRLAIRGWLDPFDMVTKFWLVWVQDCLSSGHFSLLANNRAGILEPLRHRNLWQSANLLASRIWDMLGESAAPEAQQARVTWDWERYNPVGAIEAHNWQEAEELVQAEIAARGVQGAVGWAAIVAGGSGNPAPPEILRELQAHGVDTVDEYGMFGWYLAARESARAGDLPDAFAALRKALSYWSNPPYWITDLWEKDTYWGDLRFHPEFRQAFEQRRKRIGTIYGLLHYFPGW